MIEYLIIIPLLGLTVIFAYIILVVPTTPIVSTPGGYF